MKNLTNKLRLKGFTLLELLIVIAIIALLTSISIFALNGARQQGRDGRRKSDLESIRSALELYKADCNQYPPTASFPAVGSQLTGASCTPANTNVYLSSRPGDPSTGALYYYNRTSTTTYDICSTLEGSTATTTGCGSCGAGYTCRYKVSNP